MGLKLYVIFRGVGDRVPLATQLGDESWNLRNEAIVER